jgi:hypothetical protein
MNRKYAALVGAALGGIGFFCGGGSRAEPINVTVQTYSIFSTETLRIFISFL